jgi:hypothetical protein
MADLPRDPAAEAISGSVVIYYPPPKPDISALGEQPLFTSVEVAFLSTTPQLSTEDFPRGQVRQSFLSSSISSRTRP